MHFMVTASRPDEYKLLSCLIYGLSHLWYVISIFIAWLSDYVFILLSCERQETKIILGLYKTEG